MSAMSWPKLRDTIMDMRSRMCVPEGHQLSAMSWPKLRDTMIDMRRRIDRRVTSCRLCHGQNYAIQ